MPLKLHTCDESFEQQFQALLNQRQETETGLKEKVAHILASVKNRGDAALLEFSQEFDRIDPQTFSLRLTERAWEEALKHVDTKVEAALRLAHERIHFYHHYQRPENKSFSDALGVQLGWQWSPISSVGIYVPGGTAAYPSSVLMNAIPATLAGCPRIAMVMPPCSEAKTLGALLLAARLGGVHEIYCVGGAQAIAALAYGTETIAPVAKIVGPGNVYVAEAKNQVARCVGVDMVAGPSEVLIVGDAAQEPSWIAADLLAQAEHDESAQAILITDSGALIAAVEQALEEQLVRLPRQKIARKSWENFGSIIQVRKLDESIPLINRLAPEHLQLMGAYVESFCDRILHAGAIFLGRYTPEVMGDYIGGTNHVLPTARSARFSSGLSVWDFMKRTSILRCDRASFQHLAPSAIVLGQAEGLEGHSRSAQIRLEES